MEKLQAYLGKVYTPEQTEKLIKALGILSYKGLLVQPDAHGGSLLDWSKVSIREISSTTTVIKYEVTVPLGDTGEMQ